MASFYGPTPRRRALAEIAAGYGRDGAQTGHTKLSISLPTDLVAQVQAASAETGVSISGVIAAALRRTITTADQAELDAALDAQNEENAAWAETFLDSTSKLWSGIEW